MSTRQYAKPAKAMVLAAGKGMRMGDMSRRTPKPLVMVGGQSILHRTIGRLKDHGISPVVVNIHHLADKMQAALKDEVASGTVLISHEQDGLLETGGGVKKALPMLAQDNFFVLNCDVVWHEKAETVLARLQRYWNPDQMDVLLLMVALPVAHGYEGVGDFFMDLSSDTQCGPLSFRDAAPTAPFVFGAVQIVKASMYDVMPEGAWSNREVFRKAAATGRLFGLIHTDGWFHVGTQEAIEQAEAMIESQGW